MISSSSSRPRRESTVRRSSGSPSTGSSSDHRKKTYGKPPSFSRGVKPASRGANTPARGASFSSRGASSTYSSKNEQRPRTGTSSFSSRRSSDSRGTERQVPSSSSSSSPRHRESSPRAQDTRGQGRGENRPRTFGNKPSSHRGGSGSRDRGSSSHRGGGQRDRGSRSGGGSRRAPRVLATFDPSRFINTNPVDVVEDFYQPKHTFADFALDERLSATIADMGITIPSPIQDQTIPDSLLGRDIIGLAETGTGKTAAFLVPLIQRALHHQPHKTLILAPTRELAIQIEQEFRKLARGLSLYSVTCVGGMNIRPQITNLRRPHHMVIGTPGRVLDLIERGSIKPATFRAVVLDEADRMLDMGFINDMRSILSATPSDRQTLFFSATMSKATEGLVHDFLRDPVRVSVKKKDVTDSIAQDVIRFSHSHKFETLLDVLTRPDAQRVIIFGAMKHSVEKLSQELVQHGIKATSIHGNKSHIQRQRALNAFKSGDMQVLVATDVAARGIHVDDVTYVINYDLPQTFEDYVHRIGRTGRGSRRGKALTFVPQS